MDKNYGALFLTIQIWKDGIKKSIKKKKTPTTRVSLLNPVSRIVRIR